MPHDQANVPGTTVSGQIDVKSGVHCEDKQDAGEDKNGTGESKSKKGRDRAPRSSALLRRGLEVRKELDTCKSDYNRLYDGYAELVNAHVDLLMDYSVAKGEPVGYPLMLSKDVRDDVVNEIMKRLGDQ